MAAYEHALQKLYQAPLARFVAERKRLAAELHAAGDKVAGKELAKRRRPTTSAWTVNQLYRHAHDAFADLLGAAARMRKGDLGATGDYREALANLRQRASTILKDAGHGATDALLRRVATTLAAIAAVGGFDPDPPGALAADREAPGFDALGTPAKPIQHVERTRARDAERASSHHPAHAAQRDKFAAARARAAAERKRRQSEAQERAAVRTEKKRKEAERVRRKSERRRLETTLRAARADVRAREHSLTSLREKQRAAEKAVGAAQETVQDLERKLAELEDID
jgi:hypothetical protein